MILELREQEMCSNLQDAVGKIPFAYGILL